MTDNNDLISRENLKKNEPHYDEEGYRIFYESEIDNAPTFTTEDKEKEAYRRGFEIGKKIGARAERTMTIAYLEGKTIEEDKIEQMFKNGEVEAIPYLGETAEEEPNV